MIEAAALQCVMDLAGAIGGDDDNRRFVRPDRTKFRNCHLEIGQNFQQERLEGFICPVELVDQENGRTSRIGGNGLQNRAADQETFGEDVAFDPLAVDLAGCFRQADFEHLRRIVPLVDRRGDVETFVALQPDQRPVERLGQNLGDLRLADAGFALKKKRALHPECKKQHRRQRRAGEIIMCLQQCHRLFDGLWQARCRLCHVSSTTARIDRWMLEGGKIHRPTQRLRAIFSCCDEQSTAE
ncbi:hypothetical protein FA04_07550 [Ensifer adhaerens]|nr:hypothetical protein FA04_07550 [Ensifer adhaerens]KDP74732.1 hypothetical protein FA04_04950 [Ensifer adhaerens]